MARAEAGRFIRRFVVRILEREDGGLVKHTAEMLRRVESRPYGNFRHFERVM